MKCDMCHKKEATVHLTEVINDQVTKLHLCEYCAKEKGEEMQSHFGLTDLLGSLMDFGPQMDDDIVQKDNTLKCRKCGMTYNDFQRTGKLGCADCYDSFKENMSNLLRKIHGSDRHAGKMPYKGESLVKEQESLQRLKAELVQLVQTEEFEKAAFLRDRIKTLEEKIGKE